MNTYAEYNKKLRFSLQHEKANRIFVYFVKVSKRHEKQRPKHTFFSFLSLFGKLSSFITAWLKTTRKNLDVYLVCNQSNTVSYKKASCFPENLLLLPFLLALLCHTIYHGSSIWVIFVGCPIFYLAVAIQFRPQLGGVMEAESRYLLSLKLQPLGDEFCLVSQVIKPVIKRGHSCVQSFFPPTLPILKAVCFTITTTIPSPFPPTKTIHIFPLNGQKRK